MGACSQWLLFGFLGIPGALLLPLLPVAHGLRLLGRVKESTDRSWLACLSGAAFVIPIAIALSLGATREVHSADGLWGSFVAYYLAGAFGTVGAWIVLLLAASALTAWTLHWNPIRAIVGSHAGSATAKDQPVAAAASLGLTTIEELDVNEPSPDEMPAIDFALSPTPVDVAAIDEVPAPKAEKKKREKKSKADVVAGRDEHIAAQIAATADAVPATSLIPPTELLAEPPESHAELGRAELDAMGRKLMEALRTFRVEGQLVGRTTGPTVTQFEVEPAPGVKVRQIANLSNDLALGMRAPSIRIVAPIPGKGAVGIEVPNPTPDMVSFRELVESPEFKSARAALPIALGKDLEGKPVIADLAKMPHLLIAGATGSGKSVCVNTIVTSLLYRNTPERLRLLMVDPKMVELSVYNDLPHLRHKVVTDNRDAAAVLKWAVLEMNERYELLAKNGCRNIQDFNQRFKNWKKGEGAPLKRPIAPDVAFERDDYDGKELPYVVIIIDEMADLMMTVQGEVETPIAMLAQKARAIGIHLILATQRPSVNVITGLIKANFPSRIAFRVASQIDSRTILDGAGAEALLGNGDMLFIPPGKSEASRLQGAYLSSDETEKLMGWYRAMKNGTTPAAEAMAAAIDAAQRERDILEVVREKEAEAKGVDDAAPKDTGDRDPEFRAAAELFINAGEASTSLLQRKKGVGYGRAARIIDQLEAAGVLGPKNGSKPREVLMGIEDLDRVCA